MKLRISQQNAHTDAGDVGAGEIWNLAPEPAPQYDLQRQRGADCEQRSRKALQQAERQIAPSRISAMNSGAPAARIAATPAVVPLL